jgi:DNA invertase Pin-like site-specific DNA recombinase
VPKRRLAISYSRFSDPKQAKGDSQERQDRMFRDFCQWHNLTPLAEVFADRGRSGYKDEHRKKGRLGQLIAMAKDDGFESGTVIVVEAWDRLGRLRPDKQTELVAELLRTGVSIGVCRLDDIFSEEDFGTHKWTTLAVFIQLAYQESKQKAERIGASWATRRERAREHGTPVTGRVPAWLELQHGTFRPIPEHVAAVRRLFALAGQGYGRARIIAALVAEKLPPFGGSGRWTRSYVNRLLTDRRVLGEYQPRRTDDTPDGPPIPGYYPRVITDEEWALARAAAEKPGRRDRRGRPIARGERRHVNLFRELLTHARDGQGMVLGGRVGGGAYRLLLRNLAGEAGRGKTYTFPYAVFEAAVLKLLREVDPREVLPKKERGPLRADVLRARLDNVRQDMEGLRGEIRRKFSKVLSDLLREKEAEEERVAQELQEELVRAVRPLERAWEELPDLAALVATGGNEARLRLRPVLRRVIDKGWMLTVRRCSYLVCVVQFYFAGGAHRDYLIVYQSAGRNRPGGWWARSLALRGGAGGGLDLRDPEEVRQFAEELSGTEIESLVG